MIPYRKHGLDLVVEAVRNLHQEDFTPDQTKEAISIKGQNEAIELQTQQLHDFEEIFEQAFTKLSATSQIKDILHQQEDSLSHDPVLAVLDFIDDYQPSAQTTGETRLTTRAEELALDFFFLYQDSHYFQRHFLFGIPSQKRGGP
ncbi:MAG: hypothetical protein QME81_15205 [bacterium]|nr:hypothetical protein [bacterium]